MQSKAKTKAEWVSSLQKRFPSGGTVGFAGLIAEGTAPAVAVLYAEVGGNMVDLYHASMLEMPSSPPALEKF